MLEATLAIALNEGGGLHPRNAGLVAADELAIRFRSMKAGAFTPATPAVPARRRSSRRPLNEGGGLHPRNAVARQRRAEPARARSMKAGAFTPATPAGPGGLGLALRRSMKAGAFTPATRGPPACRPASSAPPLNEGGGLHPRNAPAVLVLAAMPFRRSMKAGAFTPATHDIGSGSHEGGMGTLNEGGGLHPRNAGHRRPVEVSDLLAQ